MPKSMNITNIPDDLYFSLVELKGRLKCQNWVDFFTKVAKIVKERTQEDED